MVYLKTTFNLAVSFYLWIFNFAFMYCACYRPKPFHFAILDEVDSVLIDEGRNPLLISGEVCISAPFLSGQSRNDYSDF